MNAKQALISLGGMLMIGDAIALLVQPKRHIEAWRGQGRIEAYGRLVDFFAKRRVLTTLFAIGEGIAGAALVRRVEAH